MPTCACLPKEYCPGLVAHNVSVILTAMLVDRNDPLTDGQRAQITALRAFTRKVTLEHGSPKD